MRSPLTGRVCCAVNPFVAWAAHRHEVVRVEPPVGSRFPRVDMVKVQCASTGGLDPASAAPIAITSKHVAPYRLPCRRRIDALPFRADPATPVRIVSTCDAEHAVGLAAEPRPWLRCGRRDAGPRRRRVCSTAHRVHVPRLRPSVVVAVEVVPAWTGWDAEVTQLVVNALRIAPDKRSDLVSRETFVNVLPSEPLGVQVQASLSHAPIIVHRMAVAQ